MGPAMGHDPGRRLPPYRPSTPTDRATPSQDIDPIPLPSCCLCEDPFGVRYSASRFEPLAENTFPAELAATSRDLDSPLRHTLQCVEE